MCFAHKSDNYAIYYYKFLLSPSSRRAWIEILTKKPKKAFLGSRPPHGGRGLKFLHRRLCKIGAVSPSSRRAWIEITVFVRLNPLAVGRPPHGGRGLKLILCRNAQPPVCRPPHGGRGLKFCAPAASGVKLLSPSSRRAWIEIIYFQAAFRALRVALLTEGVD